MKRGQALEAARWSLCFAFVLFFHVAGAVALMARWTDDDLAANAPLVMIDLAPAPVARRTQPTELPPDIVESNIAEPQPEPIQNKPPIELPQQPQAELPVMPPPKPAEKPKEKPRRKQASLASAPSTAEQRAERAAGPAPGASHDPSAMPNWKSALLAQLERHKRYPPDGNGASGEAQLAFSVDRHGGVHNARIVRSSGSSALDHATLALLARAQPLPPPPPDTRGAQIAVVVPIRYSGR